MSVSYLWCRISRQPARQTNWHCYVQYEGQELLGTRYLESKPPECLITRFRFYTLTAGGRATALAKMGTFLGIFLGLK
jgi:hypothetical protein